MKYCGWCGLWYIGIGVMVRDFITLKSMLRGVLEISKSKLDSISIVSKRINDVACCRYFGVAIEGHGPFFSGIKRLLIHLRENIRPIPTRSSVEFYESPITASAQSRHDRFRRTRFQGLSIVPFQRFDVFWRRCLADRLHVDERTSDRVRNPDCTNDGAERQDRTPDRKKPSGIWIRIDRCCEQQYRHCAPNQDYVAPSPI